VAVVACQRARSRGPGISGPGGATALSTGLSNELSAIRLTIWAIAARSERLRGMVRVWGRFNGTAWWNEVKTDMADHHQAFVGRRQHIAEAGTASGQQAAQSWRCVR
jgi:hypothetical protein